MPNIGSVAVNLTIDSAQFQAQMAQASSTLVRFGATTTTAIGSRTVGASATATAAVGGLSTGLGGLGAALRGLQIANLVQMLGGASALFAESEQLQVRLRTAVENTGASFDNQKGRIDAVVEAGGRLGFRHSDLIESFSLLVTQTSSVDEALKRQAVAFDLARATGMDLTTASRLIGKVTEENTRVLQRYGIVIRQGASEQEFFATIQAKVGGQAEAQVNTTAVAAARLQNQLRSAAEGIGGLFAQNLQPLALLAIAFDSLRVNGLILGSGLGQLVERLGGLRAAGLAAAGALTPLAIAFGVVAAGVGVAVGAMKLLSNIPGLKFFGEELDQIGFIVEHIGWGGLVSELTGIGKEAPRAQTATNAVAGALDTLATSYQGVMDKMTESTVPAAATFKQISQIVKDLGGAGGEFQAQLDAIRGTLFGTAGTSAQQAMRAFGTMQLDAVKAMGAAEVSKIESVRDAALREQEAVARFTEDEAQREADFAKRLADKIKPTLETIDQLNRDLGPGFDQERRRLQAEALKARLAAEIDDMKKAEAERIAKLRPPSTPTLDKLAKEGKTLADLDAEIAASQAKWDKVSEGLKSIVDQLLADLQDRITAAEDLIKINRPNMGENARLGAEALQAGGILGKFSRNAFDRSIGADIAATLGEKKDEVAQGLADAVINFTIEALNRTFVLATTKVRQGAGAAAGGSGAKYQ